MSTQLVERTNGNGRWHRLDDDPEDLVEPSITFQWRRAGYGLTKAPELTAREVRHLPVDRLEAARAELDKLITLIKGAEAR